MITSFEVGSVFKIVDQGSPAIKAMQKSVVAFDAAIGAARKNLTGLARTRLVGVSNQFKAVTQEVFGLDRALQGTAAAIGRFAKAPAAFSGVTAAISGTSAAVQMLAAEWANVAAMAAAANAQMRAASRARTPLLAGPSGRGGVPGVVPLPGRGAGRPHGPRSGLHVSGLSANIPGGHAHFRGGGNAGMAAAGALAYGIYQEAEVEDIAARALITGQLKVDEGMRYGDAFQELRTIIQKNSISGGFSPKEVGEAVLGSERQFAGLPFKKRMEVLNTMLPFAMQEARLKETPLKESAESLVGLAHMTGTYDVAKLPDLYRKFAYASQLTPKSLPQYTSALSYAMPSLVGGMGMDPDAIMFLTAMNQAAGIGSSKAGTWIQAFFSKLMPATGANLTKSKEKHNEALKNLGILDANGKPTWLVTGENGKTDWMASLMKLSPILGGKLAAMPDVQRMQTLDDVFGKQGGREAGLFNLPEFIAQFPQLAKQLKMASGGEDVLKMYGEGSPVQQSRTAWSELTAVLMDISQVVLPPLTEALKQFSGVLKSVHDAWPAKGNFGGLPKQGTLGEALGKGMGVGALIGGGAGFFIGGVGAPLGAAIGAFAGGAYMGGRYLLGMDTGTPAGAAIAGASGSTTGVGPAGAGAAWNVVPPAQKIEIAPGKVTLNMDGKTVGEAVVRYAVREGNGATQGSPYPDTTRGGSTFDFSLVN